MPSARVVFFSPPLQAPPSHSAVAFQPIPLRSIRYSQQACRLVFFCQAFAQSSSTATPSPQTPIRFRYAQICINGQHQSCYRHLRHRQSVRPIRTCSEKHRRTLHQRDGATTFPKHRGTAKSPAPTCRTATTHSRHGRLHSTISSHSDALYAATKTTTRNRTNNRYRNRHYRHSRHHRGNAATKSIDQAGPIPRRHPPRIRLHIRTILQPILHLYRGDEICDRGTVRCRQRIRRRQIEPNEPIFSGRDRIHTNRFRRDKPHYESVHAHG